MNAKERLYAVIGGCVGAVLTMLVGSFLTVGAQSQENSFGEIRCTGLTVVHPRSGEIQITLSPLFGLKIHRYFGRSGGISCEGLTIVDSEGKERITLDTLTGLTLVARDGGGAHIRARESGGEIGVRRKGGMIPSVRMAVDEHGGGEVFILNNDGAMAQQNSEFDQNPLNVKERVGVSLGYDEHGGRIVVHGRGDSRGKAVIGVNEYGSGTVGTWDKNGYRQ